MDWLIDTKFVIRGSKKFRHGHIAIQLILYAMYYSLSSVGNVCYTVYR